MDQLDGAVVSIIRQRPRPETRDAYEAWLRDIVPIAQGFAGHRGVNVIRRTMRPRPIWSCAFRHDRQPAPGSIWIPARTDRAGEADTAEAESVDITTGLEFWFPAAGRAPRQALQAVPVIRPPSFR